MEALVVVLVVILIVLAIALAITLARPSNTTPPQIIYETEEKPTAPAPAPVPAPPPATTTLSFTQPVYYPAVYPVYNPARVVVNPYALPRQIHYDRSWCHRPGRYQNRKLCPVRPVLY